MAKSKHEIKGTSKFRGKIQSLSKENILDNDLMRKLGFGIKTSEFNSAYVQAQQWKPKDGKVYVFKDGDGRGRKEVDWGKRYKTKGYSPIGIKTKAKDDDKVLNLLQDDFINFVLEKYEDGDDVTVICNFTISSDGDKTYINNDIKAFYPTREPVDFTADDFEEMCDFSTKVLFQDANELDGKVVVDVATIDYKENIHKFKMTVSDPDSELGAFLLDTAEFGDTFTAEGILHNRAIVQENSEEEVESIGIGTKRKSMNNNKVTGYNKEIEVTYIENIIEAEYTNEDLAKLGSKGKVDNKAIADEIASEDDGDDDLPWK